MASSSLSQRFKNTQNDDKTTSSQQEDPDSHITPETAAVRNPPSSSSSSRPSDPTKSTTSPLASDPTRGWAPLNRRQSWNEQEMRHQMQEKLLGMEKGKETGFTEMDGSDGRGPLRR